MSGPSASDRPYEYTPITSENTIRLLELEPGRRSEPIRGKLSFANLATTPRYFAVSYCWGDPSAQDTITLNGGRVQQLTRSLARALRRFRQEETPLVLWADQICIDQGNTAERGTQVKYMNRIYRDAAHVMVWLGDDEDHDAKSAFNLVKILGPMFADGPTKHALVAKQAHLVRSFEGRSWEPLGNLFQLPWVGH